MDSGNLPAIAASFFWGAALFVVLRTIANTLRTDDLEQDLEWRYDVNRINELRKSDLLYRVFQPLIQLFARFNRGAFRETLINMHREIQAAGMPRYWTAAEYLGKLELLALLVSPALFYTCVQMMELPGTVMASVLTVMTVVVLRRQLASRARYRLLLIKRRMPFMLDLLTLLMEAGSTFTQALKQGVYEFRGHPVGVEFGRVLAEMSMGKSRTSALEALRDRLSDDEVTGIVGSIIQGEQLGTPLASIFRTQAEVLRMKRTQRAEAMAGEAGVNMLLPAIMIMAATVLVILGPFILSFINSELI
jgi:tight adherence protein C